MKNQIVVALLFLAVASAFEIASLTANSSCTQDCCLSLPSRPPMTYYFYQRTGRFKGGAGAYAVDVHGYSGNGTGYLNPDMECVKNTGPLPATEYRLVNCKNVMHLTVERPCSFELQPVDETQMCGRDDFFIHGCDCCTAGDSSIPPAAGCSLGCVVINYENRVKLRVGDTLIVKHDEPAFL